MEKEVAEAMQEVLEDSMLSLSTCLVSLAAANGAIDGMVEISTDGAEVEVAYVYAQVERQLGELYSSIASVVALV